MTDDLRNLLSTLDPRARIDLRRAMIHDHADRRDRSQLMRYGDENGQRLAGVIDLLTMYPDARRRVLRVLDEIDAADSDRLHSSC